MAILHFAFMWTRNRWMYPRLQQCSMRLRLLILHWHRPSGMDRAESRIAVVFQSMVTRHSTVVLFCELFLYDRSLPVQNRAAME